MKMLSVVGTKNILDSSEHEENGLAHLLTSTASVTQEKLQVSTPLGSILLISNGSALTHALFKDHYADIPTSEVSDDPLLWETSQQISQYFYGTRRQFTIPLSPKGSKFDLKVWEILQKIPFGSCTTYSKVAQALDSPKATRAVGAACGRNPLTILIPCHRVIGSRHNLVGYAGGIQRKKSLLNLERAI